MFHPPQCTVYYVCIFHWITGSLEASLWKGGKEMLKGEMPGCVVSQTGLSDTHLEIAYDKIDR
jgi:hypothetical protein